MIIKLFLLAICVLLFIVIIYLGFIKYSTEEKFCEENGGIYSPAFIPGVFSTCFKESSRGEYIPYLIKGSLTKKVLVRNR